MNSFYWKQMLCLLIILFIDQNTFSQNEKEIENTIKDSLFIEEVLTKTEKPKVLHAEPLYIDLIRDLGARKGEKEWNVGFGVTDNNLYDQYLALVEYEWAPIDRLGFEIELPFTIYPSDKSGMTPGSKLNGLKLATQYSFYVSEKRKTTLAIGYIHEFEMNEFNNYRNGKLFVGNVYNPFFVAAKRWGNNFHTLVYSGPQFINHFEHSSTITNWQINSNFHYMISGTRNFIGIEFNKEINKSDFNMIIRPQMRVGIAENVLIGIVTGVPTNKENQRFSTFFRLIYEPGH